MDWLAVSDQADIHKRLWAHASLALGFSFLIFVSALGLLRSLSVAHAELLSLCVVLVLLEVCLSLTELILRRLTSEQLAKACDYDSFGLPDRSSVVIAVPILLTSRENILEAIRIATWNIRIANDSNVVLVFISDFADRERCAPSSENDSLLAFMKGAIESANAELGVRYRSPIHLIHRAQVWVASQGVWMGHERKRGKLRLLNDLITGNDSSDHDDQELDISEELSGQLKSSRYVLCLDEDSRLTPNAVQRMAAMLDHPANSPVLSADGVTSGYGIATCQLVTDKGSASQWRLSRALTGASMNANQEPYPVGNFFFRWFGVAKFNGKGMYDPKVYSAACSALPDEKILSHDTIEGAYLRPGFVPNAAIVEAFPSSHFTMMVRAERWVRGDVQNIALVFSPRSWSGFPPMSGVARYLIILQLAPLLSSLTLFPILCYLVVREGAAGATLAVVLLMAGSLLRLLENASRDFSRLPVDEIWRRYIPYLGIILASNAHRMMLAPAVFVAASVGAITALIRLVSGRRLLAWRTMAATSVTPSLFNSVATIPFFLALTAAGCAWVTQETAWMGWCVIAIWCCFPAADAVLCRKSKDAT